MADDLIAKYATVSDVATELGREIPADSIEAKQIQRWLNRAERQIRRRVTQLDKWALADAEYKAVVNDVLVSAVERKASNPDGMKSQMTQIDDGNLQNTVVDARASGEIVILDDEWAMLLKTPTSNAFSVMAMPEPDAFPLPSYPYCY